MRKELSLKVIAQAQAGDDSSFEQIVKFYSSWVFNLAYRMTYNAEKARDASQEIFWHVYKNLDKFDFRGSFSPWFYTVATNCCINFAKKIDRDVVEFSKLAKSDHEDDEYFEFESQEQSPLQKLANKDTREFVQKCIKRLPANFRMVVTLKYFADNSIEEIAKLMELPKGTVKTWLFRAREQIKEEMKRKKFFE